MLARYTAAAGITRSLSPHKWRHFLFTWLKKQGIDDALIQPYSGHEPQKPGDLFQALSGRCATLLQSSNGALPSSIALVWMCHPLHLIGENETNTIRS